MALAAKTASLAMTAQAAALPPNPHRPMDAKTCEEALDRVREHEIGSPLISEEENRRLLHEARQVAERLCAKDGKGDNR